MKSNDQIRSKKITLHLRLTEGELLQLQQLASDGARTVTNQIYAIIKNFLRSGE